MSDTPESAASVAASLSSDEMSRAATLESTTSAGTSPDQGSSAADTKETSIEQHHTEQVTNHVSSNEAEGKDAAPTDTSEDAADISGDVADPYGPLSPLPPFPSGLGGGPLSDTYYTEIVDIEAKLERELRGSALADPLSERRKLASLRHHQSLSYATLMEDRIKDLEQRLADLEATRKAAPEALPPFEPPPTDLPPPLPSDLDNKPEMSVAWLNTKEFCVPSAYPHQRTHIIDVLNEPLGNLPLNMNSLLPSVDPVVHHRDATANQEACPINKGVIERVRINSDLIAQAFETFMEKEKAPAAFKTHVRPFKALLSCEGKLREVLEKTKERVSQAALRKSVSKDIEEKAGTESANASEEQAPKEGSADLFGTAPADHLEPSANRDDEMVEQLGFLLDFMDEHLKDGLDRFHRPRSPKTEDSNMKRTFAELWMLFTPGDLIYDPTEFQAYRVLSTSGGRPIYRYKPYDPYSNPLSDPFRPPYDEPAKMAADVPKANVFTQVETNDVITQFCINCFYLDFDGKAVGPVQKSFKIDHYDGPKDIRTLQVFPIEYADLLNRTFKIRHSESDLEPSKDSKTVLEHLKERGKKFADLPTTFGFSHQNYHGYSLGQDREHIDSDVMIDPELYYQLHVDDTRPLLGFVEPEEGDIRETQQTVLSKCYCGRPSCSLNTETDLQLFDDRNIDRYLMTQYVAHDGAVFVRFRHSQEELKSNHYELFPRTIQGFVLKERKWRTLDIELIFPVQNRETLFKDELVLPPKHKRLVESLVKFTPLGSRPGEPGSGGAGDVNGGKDMREDLVRGKGKGTVILLHGEPGVVKTSTAECVAEYTKRPLFPLTCGDLGHTAKDVQDNLTKIFQLAHRWGCVMLLDEADVFLQTRRQNDLQRNAVVSVFLRTLEYYNGILFLTTNKIDFFDPAFKSRIHVSLLYKELTEKASLKIWELNLERIKDIRKVQYDKEEILGWVKKHIKKIEQEREDENSTRTRWNGRQIHNACQTAAALAAFMDKNVLKTRHLDAVAEASDKFDNYLAQAHSSSEIAQVGETSGYLDLARRKEKERQRQKQEESARKSGKKNAHKKRRNDSDDEDEEEEHSGKKSDAMEDDEDEDE